MIFTKDENEIDFDDYKKAFKTALEEFLGDASSGAIFTEKPNWEARYFTGSHTRKENIFVTLGKPSKKIIPGCKEIMCSFWSYCIPANKSEDARFSHGYVIGCADSFDAFWNDEEKLLVSDWFFLDKPFSDALQHLSEKLSNIKERPAPATQ